VDSFRCYTVPRADGRLLVGSTDERVGFRKAVTAEGVSGLIQAALELAPGMAGAALAESWAGLRPGTPDGMPILGSDPDLPGLYYATGHFRHGILLGPLTARMVAAEIRGSQGLPVWLGPARFPG
jgi:glycine oxidase